MNGSDPSLPVDFDQRLNANVDNWKRKLLDLSRRNRALNFKSTKVSTIEIVDEHPAEIFRHLYLQETAMRFRAAEPAAPNAETPAGDAKADSTTTDSTTSSRIDLKIDEKIDSRFDSTNDSTNEWKNESNVDPEIDSEIDSEIDDASESEEALEFVPYDAASVDERHKDEWLQTRLVPEALDHSLRRIDEQARTALENIQGDERDAIFLSITYGKSADGRVRYQLRPAEPREWMAAPPYEMYRHSGRQPSGDILEAPSMRWQK